MTLEQAATAGAARRRWPIKPLWTLIRRTDVTGRPDSEHLSVYRDHGVVPKASRDDNFNKPSEDLSTYRHVRPGNLVLNKMKTWQGSLAVSEYEGIVSPAYYVCALSPSVEPRFLHYLLRSQPYIALYGSLSKGIRPNQWDLPFDEFKSIPVALPEAVEQRRIADFLDDQVARIDQAIAARREQVQVALRGVELAAFHGVAATALERRRPSPELPWSATLPGEWPVAKLSLVARMGSGHTPARSEPDYWVDCDIPWLTTSDVHRFREDEIETIDTTTFEVSRLGLANSAAVLHPAGTVALSRTASAGFSIVMGPDMATSQDFVTWKCGPRIDPYYLLWCLRAMRRDLLERLAMGSTHKTIYFPDLLGLRVPLPPLAEQISAVERIRERVGDLHQLRATLARQIGLLEERKRSLITAAVTGKLDLSSASPRATAAVMGG